MMNVRELTVVLKKLDVATYVREKCGVSFQRMLIFVLDEKVSTDRLLVTEEAVRVLDTRE